MDVRQQFHLLDPSSTLEDAHVLARIIKPPKEIIDEIIKFNNSQNPIKVWDIASQNKVQRRLKAEFETLSSPWIYLTRRGSRPTSGLRKFRDVDGKLRMIEFEIAGQHCAAFRGWPLLAYKDKAMIFTRSHDDGFPKDVRCEEVLFSHICGELARVVTTREIAKGEQSQNIVLKKGGAFFVLAVMGAILHERNGASFLGQLDAVGIMAKRMRGRLENYATFALNQYIQAARDEATIQRLEYSTLVRSPEFFERVRIKSLGTIVSLLLARSGLVMRYQRLAETSMG